MNIVKVSRGTSANYKKLTTKDPDTLYFLTDTGEIYLGDVKMSVSEIAFDEVTDMPMSVSYDSNTNTVTFS